MSFVKAINKRKRISTRRNFIMKKYVCDVCGWEYDEAVGAEDLGIAPGTKFEELPEDFVCLLCGVGADMFSEA
jgi:rubredoxin-NAD+ reductase